MADQLDVALEDDDLLAEVELTTNLMIAASESGATLPQAEVDRVLGVPDADADAGPVLGTIPAQTPRQAS